MLQSRLNQFFPTKSCVITLWIELYDPKQFDRVQRAENQSLRFQNAFFIDTFDLYQLPGNQLFTANNKNSSCGKIAIETSTQHREAQRMV